jgi:hypothetical protein
VTPLKRNSAASGFRLMLKAASAGSIRPGLNCRPPGPTLFGVVEVAPGLLTKLSPRSLR